MGRTLAPTHPAEFLREAVLPGVSLPKSSLVMMLSKAMHKQFDLIPPPDAA